MSIMSVLRAGVLIEAGADIEAKNNKGQTPLHTAVMRGDKEVSLFLVAKSADINAKDNDNFTPLHYAIFFGHKTLAGLLVEKGATLE